jgi:nucleotide-binding universal stress UspA family protein
MYRHLLVPLDGSPLAEAAMTAARYLVESLGAQVTLLHTIERKPPRTVHGQAHLSTEAAAREYLSDVARRTLPADCQVNQHVHANKIDDVARSIVSHAIELDVDLILLCTHGSGGIRHGVLGTVVQKVVALGSTPVLLVPTPWPANRSFSCRRVLVPLDGNKDHEQGLMAVGNLGSDCQMLQLLTVVPKWLDSDQSHLITSRMLPGTTSELLTATLEPSEAYLQTKRTGLEVRVGEVSTKVVRGEPANEILAAARDFAADLIVLGTHGSGYLDAFWAGRVTPKLIKKSHTPLLLVPVSENLVERRD